MRRQLPPGHEPLRWTDDTAMARDLVDELRAHGAIVMGLLGARPGFRLPSALVTRCERVDRRGP